MITQKMLPALLAANQEAGAKVAAETAAAQGRGGQEQQLAKLKSYLQGQAQQRALGQAEQFLNKDKNGNPVLGQGQGISISPEGASITRGFNPLEYERMLMSQGNLRDKQVQGISDRAQKEGIPTLQAQTDILNQDMQNSGGHLQSVGGMKNIIPDSMVPLAEYLHILPKGSAKERQDIAALRNAAQHATFGSRQTEAEKNMMGQQLGTTIGNSAENIEAGIKGLGDAANRESQNVLSGSNPEAVQMFKQRGGNIQVAAPGAVSGFDPDAFLKGK